MINYGAVIISPTMANKLFLNRCLKLSTLSYYIRAFLFLSLLKKEFNKLGLIDKIMVINFNKGAI
jgi:hypothetical protein